MWNVSGLRETERIQKYWLTFHPGGAVLKYGNCSLVNDPVDKHCTKAYTYSRLDRIIYILQQELLVWGTLDCIPEIAQSTDEHASRSSTTQDMSRTE